MTTSFDLAQQAANVAYDMTLFATGDEAQAAADYHDVMSAYNRHSDGAQETHPGWIVSQAVTLLAAQAVADEKMAEYATWQDNVKDWNDLKGDCAL